MDSNQIDKLGTGAYVNSVKFSIDFAARYGMHKAKTCCPCKKCHLRSYRLVKEVESHILYNGFPKDYKFWNHHGEPKLTPFLKDPLKETIVKIY